MRDSPPAPIRRCQADRKPGQSQFESHDCLLGSRFEQRRQFFVATNCRAMVEHGSNLALYALQLWSNLIELRDRQHREGTNGMKICLSVFDDLWNLFHALDDIVAARRGEWRRLYQRLEQGGESLIDIECWVALPSRIQL